MSEIQSAPYPPAGSTGSLGYDKKEDAEVSNVIVPVSLTVPDPVRRHIQLIAISGAIGAGVFISIGGPMTSAGPLGLLIGVAIWSFVIWCFSECLIEITTLLPLPGGFIYYSGRFVCPSIRFALGWNYVIEGVAFVCFELTAMNLIVEYWKPDINPAICITLGLVGLGVANGVNVRWYGEIEFWISIFKVFLLLGLFFFTFITMVGGNPQHDVYGFRFWKDPGLFASADAWGRLKGVWASIVWSAFAIVGPDFISMVSGETASPRRILPKCFNSTIYRVLIFYMGSALCVGINTPYNDPALLGAIAAGAPGAAKSPYIINMNRLGIPVLPHIVNACVLTSVFSTASSFTYAASRSLYSLSLEGQAPKLLSRTNRYGVPYIAVTLVLAVGCLSYLSLSSGTAKVLDWFINLTASCQLICWVCIGLTWIRFRAGLKAQGLIDGYLPVRGKLQPYAGWFAFISASFTLIFCGSSLMAPGGFDPVSFVFTYGAVFIFVLLFTCWKIKNVWKGEERWLGYRASEMDMVGGVAQIDALTAEDEEGAARPVTVMGKVEKFLF